MNAIVVTVLVVLIFLVIGGIILLLSASDKAMKKERALSVIKGTNKVVINAKDKKSQQDKRRDELSRKLKESEDQLARGTDKKVTTSVLLMQAGMTIKPKQFWLFSFLFAVVITLLAKISGQSNLVVMFVFIIGFLGLPRMFLKRKIKKRQKKFLEDFAEALEAMVRLLKSGMPITEAIAMVSREYVGPLGEEMMRIYEAQKVGISLPDAVLDATKRMPITEMNMFATGISIQAQTGASLSEVLMNLAGVIRARFRLRRKVVALSQEAKSSAMIIGSLPFLVGGGLFALNPEYMDLLVNTTVGRILIAFSVIWMGIGIFIMKAMINFKI